MFDLKTIDNSWTLFLDRDGVINFERNNDYVKAWDEFKFYEESILALPLLAQKFSTIVITTNQKGVGRGLMTEESLNNIHHNMVSEIVKLGGRIDHIFYCTDLDNDSINRKPKPGMAFQAKDKFSMEQDYLEKYSGEGNFYGFIQEGYFIDIGIPEDFVRAQIELL